MGTEAELRAVTCRSDWYADTGRRQYVGDRIVRCGLPAGHDCDHDELIDGEAGAITWRRRTEPSASAVDSTSVEAHPAFRILADHYRYLGCGQVVDPLDLEDCGNVAAESVRVLRAAGLLADPQNPIGWAGQMYYEAGYEQAITHLRDTDAFMAWAVARMPVLHAVRVADAINAADYLSARLTEETTNG